MRSDRPLVTLISAITAEESIDTERSWWGPPLGVLSLAAVLKSRDVDTEVIDLNLLWRRSAYSSEQFLKNVAAAVRASRPRILGLSTICNSYPLTLRIAETLKRDFPRTPIVMGGPQASAVDVATLKAFPFVDFILRGEAEETFPMLVESLLAGGSPNHQRGLTFRDGPCVQRNADAAPILDLDTLPLPFFDAYADVSQWPSLPLEIGRGCPFSCRFCSTSGFFRRSFRLKSRDHVIGQMNFLSQRYGARAFDLIHDMFTADRRRVAEFCHSLQALGSPYKWCCSARTDWVDAALLTLMRDAGCSGVFFGIETGSPRLQRVVRKDLDLDRARSVLRECDRLGLNTTASLIVGYPGETARDLQATLSFFARTVRLDQADAQLHVLTPLAGTSLEVEYRSRLTFDDACSDIPEFGAGQGAADRVLIKKHPEVFGQFYAFPNRRKPAELCHISAFFVNLQERCRGLLIALIDGPARPLELFETWVRQGGRGERSVAYYRRLKFVEEFLEFVGAFYVGQGSTAVDVMWRFYSALRSVGSEADSSAGPAGADDPGQAADAIVRLSPGVRIVSVRGDVVKVLECLKKGRKPGSESLDRVTTVSVRKATNGRSVIEELPPLGAAILSCLDGSVDEIVRRLTVKGVRWENRNPGQFVPEALRVLEFQGFVKSTAGARPEGSTKGCRVRATREKQCGRSWTTTALAGPPSSEASRSAGQGATLR
jgi:radical SAM superfamily enzyme YgiQ (UPF0313 family)